MDQTRTATFEPSSSVVQLVQKLKSCQIDGQLYKMLSNSQQLLQDCSTAHARQVVDRLFGGVFCQKVLIQFKKKPPSQANIDNWMKKCESKSKVTAQFQKISENEDSTPGTQFNFNAEKDYRPADFLEEVISLTLQFLTLLVQQECARWSRQIGAQEDQNICEYLLDAFLKHLRWHESKREKRRMEYLNAKRTYVKCQCIGKHAKNCGKPLLNVNRIYDHEACLPSAVVLLNLFQVLQPQAQRLLYIAAKKKGIVNKLIGVLPQLFEHEFESLQTNSNAGVSAARDSINLNKLVLSQSRVRNTQSTLGCEAGKGTIESALTSIRGSKQVCNFVSNDQSEKNRFRRRNNSITSNNRYTKNLRSSSEPPQDFTNGTQFPAVDVKDKVESSEASVEIKHSQTQVNRFAVHVPPIMINQLPSQSLPPFQTQASMSTNVMNNFFNAPHGQLYNTSGPSSGQGHKNSHYKNYSQNNMIALSRLSRRQQSFSRQLPNNTLQLSMANQNITGNRLHSLATPSNNYNSPKKRDHDPYADLSDAVNRQDKPNVPKLNLNRMRINSIEPLSTSGLQPFSLVKKEANLPALSSTGGNIVIPKHNGKNSPSVQSSNQEAYQTNIGRESLYDNENNSFIDAQDGNPLVFENAQVKLEMLAIQLGEACLTQDLAALISQKRDMDLVESARKIGAMPSLRRQWTKNSSQLGLNGRRQTSQRLQLNLNQMNEKDNFTTTQTKTLLETNLHAVEYRTKSQTTAEPQRAVNLRKYRMRTVILNLIEALMTVYSNEETRFLRQPIQLFCCYLTSSAFRAQREAHQIKELRLGFSIKKQLARVQSDNVPLEELECFSINVDGTIVQSRNQNDFLTLGEKRLAQKEDPKTSVHVQVHPDFAAISKLLNKFSFVNEEILKSQVVNELKNFTSRDLRFSEFQSVMVNQTGRKSAGLFTASQHRRGLGNTGLTSGAVSSHSLLRLTHQTTSVERNCEEEQLSKADRLAQISSMENPSYFWSTNGIAYNITAPSDGNFHSASTVSKETIRRKLDVLLYSVSRHVRFIITSSGFERTSFEFVDQLAVQVVTLATYLETNRSRCLINQFIDVCLEPVLMIKKVLIDIGLSTNILVMDFTKDLNINDLQNSAKGLNYNAEAPNQTKEALQNSLILRQQRIRELFGEFLRLAGVLLSMPQSADTLKLFNEVLVFDESFQESVKTLTVSLFLTDLVGSAINKSYNHFQQQVLDDLRGINIVNFNEQVYSELLVQLRDKTIQKRASEAINKYLLCALNVMRYLKAVLKFFSKAINLHFATSFEPRQKAATPNEQQVQFNPYQASGVTKEQAKVLQKEVFEQRRYWKHVIRRVLYQLMFLITQPNGLFYQYLQNNAINYQNLIQNNRRPTREGSPMSVTHKYGGSSPQPHRKASTFAAAIAGRNIMRSPSRIDFSALTLDQDTQATPINLLLTNSILTFMRSLFDLPGRFSKYVFDEELMLSYIRTHYINFVKLYNKNFTSSVEDISDTPKTLTAQQQQQENVKFLVKHASMTLCKKHVSCLFAIAKNRDEPTRRKLFQFKIVQFLLQEIELEYDVQQRREKFLKLSKEEQEKANQQHHNQNLAKHQPKDNKSKLTNLKMAQARKDGLIQVKLVSLHPKKQDQTPNQNLPPIPPLTIHGKTVSSEIQGEIQFNKKPAIGKLNLSGLSFSSLQVGNTGKTQEELDVAKIVSKDKKPSIQMESEPQIDILDQSVHSKINITDQSSTFKPENDSALEIRLPPVEKKKSLVPSLKIGGLGLSSLKVGNTNKTAEELDVANLLAGNLKVPAPKASQNKLFDLEEEEESPAANSSISKLKQIVQNVPSVMQPPPRKPFVPSLMIKGLGMSSLKVGDTGKTAEELDVANLVASNNKNNDGGHSSSSGDEEYYAELEKLNKQKAPQPKQSQSVIYEKSATKITAPLVQQRSFALPKLQIGGLGLSTIKNDQGKTMEELDVISLISNNAKPHGNKAQIVPNTLMLGVGSVGARTDKVESQKSPPDRISKEKSNIQSQTIFETQAEAQKTIQPEETKSLPAEFRSGRNRVNQSALQSAENNIVKKLRLPQVALEHAYEGTQKSIVSPNVISGMHESQMGSIQFPQQSPLGQMFSEHKKSISEADDGFNRRNQLVKKAASNHMSMLNQFKQSEGSPKGVRIPYKNVQNYELQHGLKTSVITELSLSAQKESFSVEQETTEILDMHEDVEAIDFSEEVFYAKEKTVRPIYQDDELHVMMLALMICLLLKPQRGTLDELYCVQFPVDNDVQNVLYLLQIHLAHEKNKPIIPKLLRKIKEISPPLAGQRLLKLLCPSLFDLSLYNNGKDWEKLAEGAYGIVYECQMNIDEPKSVAIKQMSLPTSIYDRCVLHDIFTEITCLEEFRLEPCVTDLYDYGVDSDHYYIIMKKYTGSLTDWRRRHKEFAAENLSMYLSIFRDILKCFKTIHAQNVTHYDIKSDNILIKFKGSDSFKETEELGDDYQITVGDFGECRMYADEQDELNLNNRGTPFIQSPEMLMLAINTRKDTDKYDRRKQVGTNSLSDVWSLGCLFYELLTGELLFQCDEYFEYHLRLTRNDHVLLQPEKLEKINNNVYLIDFLKYVLIRDSRMRPTIDNILKRFEHVHALLVGTSARCNLTENTLMDTKTNYKLSSLPSLLASTYAVMKGNGEQRLDTFEAEFPPADELSRKESEAALPADCEDQDELRNFPQVMRIMEDVFLASSQWVTRHSAQAVSMGITNIVISAQSLSQELVDKFEVFAVPDFDAAETSQGNKISMNAFLLMPATMDFLRKVALFKGRILFVEKSSLWPFEIKGKLVCECLLLCLTAIYQISAYETYTLLKSQNLFFSIPAERIRLIANWTQLCAGITQHLSTYPRFSCICGSCVIVLKRQFANYNNMQVVKCACSLTHKGQEGSVCPTNGCKDFIKFLHVYYKQHVEAMLPEKLLHWGFLEENDFMLGPNGSGEVSDFYQRQIASNISRTIDTNCELVYIADKSRLPGGGSVTPGANHDIISKSSNTMRRQGWYANSALGNRTDHRGTIQGGLLRWQLFKCRECQVWTHAYSEVENRYALLLNNRQKNRKLSRMGLLAGQNDKAISTIRVPILEETKLKVPF